MAKYKDGDTVAAVSSRGLSVDLSERVAFADLLLRAVQWKMGFVYTHCGRLWYACESLYNTVYTIHL